MTLPEMSIFDYNRQIADLNTRLAAAESALAESEARCAVYRQTLIALQHEYELNDCKDDRITEALASDAGKALLVELESLRETRRLAMAWKNTRKDRSTESPHPAAYEALLAHLDALEAEPKAGKE